MNQQRIELLQGHPLWVAGQKSKHFIISAENLRAKTAEQPHHRQVHLAMTGVNRGIDKARIPLRTDQQVASPQLSVES